MKHFHPGRLREALLDATEAAVDRDGVQGVRLSDIAAEVGCAVSSLYAHFKDRDEMVAAAMARAFCRQADRDMEALSRLLDDFTRGHADAATTLSVVLVRPNDPDRAVQRRKRLRVLALLDEHPALMAEVRATQERLNTRLQELIRLGQAAGLLHPEISPKAFALLLQAIPTVLLLNDLADETRVDDTEWSEAVLRMVRAFAAPQALSSSAGPHGDST